MGEAPLAYLYLSQIPYTGLELGTFGTIIYWLALILWSLALAYLVLFGAVPIVGRSARGFGLRVQEALNAVEPVQVPEPLIPAASPVAKAMFVAPVQKAPAVFEDTPEPSRAYSPYEGFKSFARNGALSIDDIVKGLAHSRAMHSAEPNREEVQTEPTYEHTEPIDEIAGPTPSQPVQDSVRPTRSKGLHGFISVLVQGNREEVFATLRDQVKNGTSPEVMLTASVCLLDDAYRARIDGTPCDPDVALITSRLDTTTLEKLVTALATAVDSSYSSGVTGAKLALTRALAVLGA